MTTLARDRAAIAAVLADMPHLAVGVGSRDSACTVAVINLALTGEVTDDCPDCMSPVLHRAVIVLQDAMPAELRDSASYRALVHLMAGTADGRDDARLAILQDWMWTVVLPTHQAEADRLGYGDAWEQMCSLRTYVAAKDASAAAEAAGASAAAQAAIAAAKAVWAAGKAAWAASVAAQTAGAAKAAKAAKFAKAAKSAGVAWAAEAARAAAKAADAAGAARDYWAIVDPVGLVGRFIDPEAST